MKTVTISQVNPIVDFDVNISNWGCCSVKYYENKLREMATTYEKNKNKAPRNSRYVITTQPKNLAFKEYPLEVAVQFFGYAFSGNFNCTDYSNWCYSQIANNEDRLHKFAKYWRAFDSMKEKFFWTDLKSLFKKLDYSSLFDTYYPNDFYSINFMLSNPSAILKHLTIKLHKLTINERTEAKHILDTEFNRELIAKLIKRANKKIQEFTPTIEDGVNAFVKDLFADCNNIVLNGSVFDDVSDTRKLFNTTTERTVYYQNESNYNDNRGRSIKNIIMYTLSEKYPNDVDLLEAFQSGVHIVVTDDGYSSTDNSAVVSSSCWSNYNHDFTVDIYVYPHSDIENDKPVISKKFENVTVGSSYYSGGW